MEKLTYEDAFVMEIVVNKINEIITRLDELEDRLDGRISAHWKYHRLKEHKEDRNAEGNHKDNK